MNNHFDWLCLKDLRDAHEQKSSDYAIRLNCKEN